MSFSVKIFGLKPIYNVYKIGVTIAYKPPKNSCKKKTKAMCETLVNALGKTVSVFVIFLKALVQKYIV